MSDPLLMGLLRKGLRMKPDLTLGLEWSYETGTEYLGDGVYVRMDDRDVVLRTDRQLQVDDGNNPMLAGKTLTQEQHHIIVLDPAVLKKLNEYAERLDRLDRLETERAS